MSSPVAIVERIKLRPSLKFQDIRRSAPVLDSPLRLLLFGGPLRRHQYTHRNGVELQSEFVETSVRPLL